MIRGRDVGMTEAVLEALSSVGLEEEAVVIIEFSCKEVSEFVAVGLILWGPVETSEDGVIVALSVAAVEVGVGVGVGVVTVSAADAEVGVEIAAVVVCDSVFGAELVLLI